MSDDRTQINIRVDKETKQKWEDHVEQHPVFSDLSSYIRHSVENQIERDE